MHNWWPGYFFLPVTMLYTLIPVLYKCFKINKKLEKKVL